MIPPTMRYVAAREPGPPESLHIAEVGAGAESRRGPDRGHASPASTARTASSARALPAATRRVADSGPRSPARIVALGDGVDGVARGDLVCALTPGGGYAEYCTTPAAWCLPMPQGLSLLDAASLPGELLHRLEQRLRSRASRVGRDASSSTAASSGIGLTAIQLAKAFGATVFTTVGSAEKAAFCRDIGADHVINYREQDFVAEVPHDRQARRRRDPRHGRR